jgi:methionyl-tRNA formyltransferase
MNKIKKKIFIASSREIGTKCLEWAKNNTPDGYILTDSLEDCDILISVMFDKILKNNHLKNKKCFNFHPGILPEYKGVGIFSWVIINQESKAGVTLHLMDNGIDTGDIIEIREFMISPDDTAYSLFLRGEALIYKMFKDWYFDLLSDNFIAVPQKLKDGKVYKKSDLQKAKNLTKFAKAFYFPGKESAFYFNNNSEKIFLEYKDTK